MQIGTNLALSLVNKILDSRKNIQTECISFKIDYLFEINKKDGQKA
ncbi:hypothetical protein N9U70_00125 [Paracoccaceae bacterium]|nr:hypothetical protein [Paracoccaceae bacterium]